MYLWAYLCILLVWATVAAEGSLEVPRIHVDRQKVWSKLPLTPFAQSARETVILSSSIDNSNLKVPTSTKSAASLGVILPWLYFLCSSINLTTLPKYVNYAINGNTEVSPQSAQVYGLMGGLDALFTFLSVNYVGILSDRYGRKPFMIMASAGLGSSYVIMSRARKAWWFFVAAAVDGLTSCMLSQAQALVADNQPAESNLSIALSKFQGIAIGLAFTLGVPLGGWIAAKYGIDAPLKVSSALCAINCILIALLLPNKALISSDRKAVNFFQASPFGALHMLTRSRRMVVCAIAYVMVCLAHAGMQATWVNYLSYRFQWSTSLSGATLVLIGVAIAVLPPLFIPLLGTLQAIKLGTLTHALSLAWLAFADSSTSIFTTLPFVAAGSSVMPILLGYMTEQVPSSEIGALQGACETARTIANALGSPVFARIFATAIKHRKSLPPGLALLCAGLTSALGGAFFTLMQRYQG